MSNRYTTIATMLSDPYNLACVLREVARLEKLKETRIVPPPLYFNDGDRVVFPTFREFLRMKTITYDNPEQLDYILEIFYVGNNEWFLSTQDNNEIGPFTSRTDAINEAYRLLGDFKILERNPWTDDDLKDFPL